VPLQDLAFFPFPQVNVDPAQVKESADMEQVFQDSTILQIQKVRAGAGTN
jgi:hypothetical protein